MGTIDRQHAVEVINLVLKQFRPVALKLGLVHPTAQVAVADANAVGTKHTHQQVGEREAIVPHREVLVSDVNDFGIDQNPRLIHFDIDQTKRGPDLRRGDAPSAAKPRLPVVQRIRQIIHDHSDGRRLRIGDQFAALAKYRVAQKANSTHSHGAKVGRETQTVNWVRIRCGSGERANALRVNRLRRGAQAWPLPTVLLLSALVACSDSTGGSTPTNKLTPNFVVTEAFGGTTLVFGQLESDAFASVRLPEEDEMVATAQGQAKPMRWTVDPVGGGFYSASLSQVDPGTNVTIVLTRHSDASAPASIVRMPETLEETAPVVGQVATSGTNLIVAWTPSGLADPINIVLRSVVCDEPGAGTTFSIPVDGDPGSQTITLDQSLLPNGMTSGESCEVDVRVQRTVTGTVDPAYAAGGSIIARATDVARIVVVQP